MHAPATTSLDGGPATNTDIRPDHACSDYLNVQLRLRKDVMGSGIGRCRLVLQVSDISLDSPHAVYVPFDADAAEKHDTRPRQVVFGGANNDPSPNVLRSNRSATEQQ